MGTGIQGEELYREAKEAGFTPVSVGEEGQKVGVAGGYLLGGGHSSKYGLSVDKVIALQVVLANGTFMTVTEETDLDAFWALRGVGGRTSTLDISKRTSTNWHRHIGHLSCIHPLITSLTLNSEGITSNTCTQLELTSHPP